MNTHQNQVGVLGATSFVGTFLLRRLAECGKSTIAFSRREIQQTADRAEVPMIEWRRLTTNVVPLTNEQKIPLWICLAPIFTLPDYFDLLEAYGVKRIVALSSTSRFTKEHSSNLDERILAKQLAEAEARLQTWAKQRGVEWIILRPTLIYGFGRDKNIGEITQFIQRFGFFPVFGKALGLRQPVHVDDVAKACLAALQMPASANCAYSISGAEVLTYRAMVGRVFSVSGKKPRFLPIPLWIFGVAVTLLRCFPRYRKWSYAMAERMNCDMVFDHSDATRDFGFEPRSFVLSSEDIPT